jgi:integrase
VCFGLRISEALALKWSDVDWLKPNGKLTVERGIVRQHVDDVKTEASQRRMSIDAGLIEVLKSVEADNTVFRARGLDLCGTGTAWPVAVVLPAPPAVV